MTTSSPSLQLRSRAWHPKRVADFKPQSRADFSAEWPAATRRSSHTSIAIVEVHEPVRTQGFRPELPVRALHKRIVCRRSGQRNVKQLRCAGTFSDPTHVSRLAANEKRIA